MDIALTGGTGFVGRTLARRLAERGHTIRLLVRSGSAPALPPSPVGPPPSVHEIDWNREETLVSAMRGADAVIHLVGIIAEVGPWTFERVHTELTDRAVRAAHAAGVGRFVHMSALGTRPDARSRYHRTKWEGEERVRAGEPAWTIFRPSLIYGPEDAFTRLFAGLSRWSPVLPVMGSGKHLLQPIAVDSVARAFVGSLDLPETAGHTYELCGPERLTFEEALRAILKACGRRRGLIRMPWWIARAQAALLEAVFPTLLRRPPPLNRDQLLMLQEDNVGDGAPADRTFGLVHRPFLEGLRSYLSPARGFGRARSDWRADRTR